MLKKITATALSTVMCVSAARPSTVECTGNIDTQFIKKRMPAYVSAPKKMKGMSDTELARAIIESMYLA